MKIKQVFESDSDEFLNRVEKDWKKVAKEELKIEKVKGAYYAWGSELAVLRLFHYYNKSVRNKKTRANYSTNMKSWYFELELQYSNED